MPSEKESTGCLAPPPQYFLTHYYLRHVNFGAATVRTPHKEQRVGVLNTLWNRKEHAKYDPTLIHIAADLARQCSST